MMDRATLVERLQDFEAWAEQHQRELRDKGAGQAALTMFFDSRDRARRVIAELMAGGANQIRTLRVETVKQAENLFEVVSFRAALKDFSGTEVNLRRPLAGRDLLSLVDDTAVPLNGDWRNYQSQARFVFGEPDAERHLIETLPCLDASLIARFQTSGTQVLYSVLGLLVPVTSAAQYVLLLLDLSPVDNPLGLVEASVGEVEEATRFIASFFGRSMLTSIRTSVMSELDIADNGDPAFIEALEATILAAASHGRVAGESARIHTFLVGPPGCGKGKLAKVAAALQPIVKQVEPQALTEEGLYGNAGYSGGRRLVRAGLIPQSHQGVFIVEDFHQANALKNQRLTIAFTAVMERGRCEAGNASRASYAAEVAVHIDANRNSEVDARKKTNSSGLSRLTLDVNLPTNTLTRVDYLVEFQKNPVRQLKLALDIAGRAVGAQRRGRGGDPALRSMRIALSLLRERHPEIDIDDAAAAYLRERFGMAVNVDAAVLVDHPEFADFLTRGVKTFRKFAMAHARLCNRSQVRCEDIDAVFCFVLRKVATVLLWLVGDLSSELNETARKGACLLLIRLKFPGQTVTTRQVHALLNWLSEKTIGRYLRTICGEQNPDGTWVVPVWGEAAACSPVISALPCSTPCDADRPDNDQANTADAPLGN